MKNSTKIQRKQIRMKRLLSLFLVITIISILFVFTLKSDFFNIDKVNINGNLNLTYEKVLHISSIQKGENIFRISTKEAAENISGLSYVKSVNIKRKLPRAINIEIVERNHKVLIKNMSMYYIIDQEGYVLNEIDSNIEHLPVVIGLKTDRIVIGDNVFKVLDVLEFEDLIKESERLDLLNYIKEIQIDDEDNVNIIINNGIDIAFGVLDNVKYKLRMLNEILDYIKDNEILANKIIMNKGEHPIIVVDD